ncbi:MAG: 2-oxoacid:acceptor oxidoreductase family protein [Bacillota bacterium]
MPGSKEETKPAGSVQILLSGSGGQGLILIGIILAAAAIADGRHAVQTQAYGPEARGGASRAEVIIGPEYIDYPHVDRPDIMLALTQEACEKYLSSAAEDAFVIVDSLLVEKVPETAVRVNRLPIVETAKNRLGKEMVANIVALGALNSATKLVSWESLEAAVLERVPPATADLNRRALEAGRMLIDGQCEG